MSAICGIISKNGKLDKELCESMESVVSQYNIDRIDQLTLEKEFFVCGHQYITNEAVTDSSPIFDKDNNFIFLADCFLYNRKELIEKINNKKDFEAHLDTCGDAELAYYAYITFGNEFVNYLRGSFAFAIYMIDERKLLLISDHFSKRYLCYYSDNENICFGSTYKIVKASVRGRLEVNREFIVNCYRDMSPMNFFLERITPYKDMYHVDNATIITIDVEKGTESIERYWNPLSKIKKKKNLSDDEYKRQFRELYSSLVESSLRARKETGIMLSGGLDSASVASLAAPLLKQKEKKLFSYTTVPAKGYETSNISWIIENETSLVEEQRKFHGNISTRYISGEDFNCMDFLSEYQREFGIPVKPGINNINIDRMSQAAKNDECSILLSGGNGNATVSYGHIGEYISLCLEKGKVISAFKEMSNYCKAHDLSNKTYLKKWIKVFTNNMLVKPEENRYYLKIDDVKKYDLQNNSYNTKKQFGTEYYLTERQKNNFMYIPMQYIQKGFYYTNLGLIYGYLMIDPTLTVEMVEFCLSLPNECFVHDGMERRLVKVYMNDLIPSCILSEKKGHGVQAADFVYRIDRDWDRIKESIYDIMSETILREYLDSERLDELIEEIKNNEYHLEKATAWNATLIASLGYFLRDNVPKVDKK